MSLEEAPPDAGAAPGLAGLTIERIEDVPIRVPLARDLLGQPLQDDAPVDDRDHAGAHARGDRRRGVRGDEDAALLEIDAIVRDEIAPAAASARTPSGRALLGARAPGDLRHPARPPARPRRLRRASTPRSGTPSARRSASRSGGSGAATASRIPMISIGGYYGRRDDRRRRSRSCASAGLAGMKFKVGGLTPDGGRRRGSAPRARGGRRRLRAAAPTPTRAGRREQAISFARLRRGPRPPLVRGARASGPTTAARMRDVRMRGGRPRLRRAERVLRRPAAAT